MMKIDEDSACPIYILAWSKMISEKNKAKGNQEKLKVMIEFGKTFTLLPDDMSKFQTLAAECGSQEPLESSFDFPYLSSHENISEDAKNINWSNYDELGDKLIEGYPLDAFAEAENALKFPHEFLQEFLTNYSYYAARPITKKMYEIVQKSQTLYEQMTKYENDIDEWLKYVAQIEDKEAIIANLELKLGEGSNWTSQKLWKFYFCFLKNQNSEAILEVYRKYTRLFPSNKEAVQSYRDEIEKFASQNKEISKFWIDTINFEMDFGNLKFAYSLFQHSLQAIFGINDEIPVSSAAELAEKIQCFGKYAKEIDEIKQEAIQELLSSTTLSKLYFANPKSQNLCFHQNFIRHILKTGKGEILRKLYATCKHFYSIQKSRLCHRLDISNKNQVRYFQESMHFKDTDQDLKAMEKLHLYGLVLVDRVSDRNFLSLILSRIYRCDAKHILIIAQNLSLNEFRFLISENLLQIELLDCNVENTQIVDGINAFEFAKKYSNFMFFTFLNQQQQTLVCFSSKIKCGSSAAHYLKTYSLNFETVYLEGMVITSDDVLKILQSTNLKLFKLRNMLIKDESRKAMSDDSVKKLVESRIAKNVAFSFE